ncbi:tail fiber domain-containing protein [Yersinia intermedia]|uniref:tail fiber domain-containing protein n=1 Tax=Yersinia intermedia TaxID=631 RepID=UPI0030D31057
MTLVGAGFDIQNAAGSSMLQGFDASRNLAFAASFTGPTVAVTTAVRPSVPNVGTCGDAAHPWAGGYSQTAFTITSDMRVKQDIKYIPDGVLDAWGDIDWYLYRLIDAVEKKEEAARYHAGVLAQEVMAVFQTNNLDAENLGLVIYKSWPESIEIIDGEEVTVIAGDSYSVRYTEALCIEAAFNRRERARLEARIAVLESKLI